MTIFYLAVSLGRKPAIQRLLPEIFLIGGLGVSWIGLLFWKTMNHRLFFTGSTFYQSDVFAGYLLLLIFLSASLAVRSSDFFRLALYGAATLCLTFSLFLSASRAAILIFLFLLPFWGFLIYPKQVKAGKWTTPLFLFLAVFGIFYFPHLVRFQTFRGKIGNLPSLLVSASSRFSFWKGAFRIFLSHPWLGSGPDTFGRLFPQYQEHFFWYSRYPHNAYLQMLCEGGIFTSLFFFALLFWIIFSGIRSLRRGENSYPLAVGLWISVLAGLLHQFFDVDSNFLSWSSLFWAEAGLLAALGESKEPACSRLSFRVVFSGLAFAFLVFRLVTGLGFYFDQQAAALQTSGKYQAALEKETQAIRLFPLSSSYYDRKAGIELSLFSGTRQEKWLNQAVSDWKKALSLDPVRPMYWGELAGVFSSLPGGLKTSEKFLREALRWDPQNYPSYYVTLGDLELSEGKFFKARRFYAEVISQYPEDQVLRLPFFRKNDFEMARSLAYLGLARAAFQERRVEEGEKELREALRIARDQVGEQDLEKSLREEYGKEKEWQKNMRSFQVKIFTIGGDLYKRAGKPKEAIHLWREGLKLDPSNPILRKRLYQKGI